MDSFSTCRALLPRMHRVALWWFALVQDLSAQVNGGVLSLQLLAF